MIKDNETRHKLFFGLSFGLSVFVAFLVGGWHFAPLDFTFGLTVVGLGSLIIGSITGEDLENKIFHILAGVILSFGILIGTVWYITGRSSVWNFEIILPAVLGGIPGGVAYVLFRKLEHKREARILIATVFLGATILGLGMLGPKTEQELQHQELLQAENQPAIPIPVDARGVVRSQFGQLADDLLERVDTINSMVEIYSLQEVVTKTDSAVEQLKQSLTALVKVAIAKHGAEALKNGADFRLLREVVGSVNLFLKEAEQLKPTEAKP